MKIAHALLPAILLVGCDANLGSPPPQTSTGTEGLTLRIASPERLAGSYLDGLGHEIDFDTARTPDALFMDVRGRRSHELIHAETVGDHYVFQYMDRRLTLTVDKAWVARSRPRTPRARRRPPRTACTGTAIGPCSTRC